MVIIYNNQFTISNEFSMSQGLPLGIQIENFI